MDQAEAYFIPPSVPHAGRLLPAMTAASLLAMLAGSAVAQDCDGDGVPDATQTYRWQGTGPGFWGSPSNWDSATSGAPQTSSLAIFDGSIGLGQPPYFTFLDGFVGLRGLGVLNSETLFDLGGSVMAVSGSTADCREFLLGGPQGALLTLTGGGQFRINRAVLADIAQTEARLVLDGANAPIQLRHLSQAPMIIGQFGVGKVELLDAQFIHDGPLVLGSRSGSDGSIVAIGGTELLLSAEVSSIVSVGFEGDGVIRLEGGATMTGNGPIQMTLGERVGGFGEVQFIGLSQAQSVPFSLLEIGGQGSARWTVAQGSTVATSASVRIAIGAGFGSTGVARILDFSDWSVLGVPLEIGPGGQGTVAVGEGSVVSAGQDVLAFVDGVIEGSGQLDGTLRLIGGEIRPVEAYAETSARQCLAIDGDLVFSGNNPMTGEFETGRLVYTLASPDPQRSNSVLVGGSALLDGTLRVRVPSGVEPELELPYPVVEAGSLSGTFRGVQTAVIENRIIAVPTYSGGSDASVEFMRVPVEPSVLTPGLNATAPGEIADAVVRDVNRDGFPDLVAVADNGPGQQGTIFVSFNLGIATNGDWLGFDNKPLPYGSLGDLPASLAIGDMDGDELPDIVVMNRGPADGQVRIRLNSPTDPGDFSAVDPREVSVQGTPADIALADISADGLLDIITVYQRATRGASSGGIRASLNDSGSGFDDSDGDTGDDPGSVDTMGGEITPSGVAVTSKGEDAVFVYGAAAANTVHADRGPVFPLFFLQEVPTGRVPDSMFTADLNGDGLDDIVSSDRRSGTISVLLAQDFGEIIYADAISLEAGLTSFDGNPGSIVVLDINDDSRPDLVYTARDAQGAVGLRAIFNIAKGDQGEIIFSESVPIPLSGSTPPRILAVADLDADGEQDLVVVREPGNGPDVSTFLAPGPQPCNPADLAAPLGVLDLADINAFVSAFVNQQPAADLAAPFGVLDLADINAFAGAFISGCP